MARGPRVFLADFGLARDMATGSRFTRTGTTLGTPAYMSPELARGEVAALTPASDVWALGCVLHELLAGEPPFRGDHAAAVIGEVLTAARPPLEWAPRPVNALCDALLRKAPERRPPNAGATGAACTRVLAGETPLPRRRSPALALVGVLLVAVGLLLRSWQADRPEPLPAAPPAPAPAPFAAAEARAIQGWQQGHADPAAGASLLEEALAAAPARHLWRVRLGLLRWATGEVPEACRVWAEVPAGTEHYVRARLYRALATWFTPSTGRRIGSTASTDDFRIVAESGGEYATLGQAGLEATRQNVLATWELLKERTDWPSALFRALLRSSVKDPDPAAAIREYDYALSRGVPLSFAYTNRGILKRQLGDDDGALADLDRALQLAPSDAFALSNRGVIRRQVGDAAGALRDFDAAIAAAPEMPLGYVNRALIHEDRKDDAACASDLDAAFAYQIGRFTKPGPIRAWRARVRERLGELAGALSDWRAVLAIDPRDHAAAIAEVRLLMGLERLAEARPRLERFLQDHPRSRQADKVRGWLAECLRDG